MVGVSDACCSQLQTDALWCRTMIRHVLKVQETGLTGRRFLKLTEDFWMSWFLSLFLVPTAFEMPVCCTHHQAIFLNVPFRISAWLHRKIHPRTLMIYWNVWIFEKHLELISWKALQTTVKVLGNNTVYHTEHLARTGFGCAIHLVYAVNHFSLLSTVQKNFFPPSKYMNCVWDQ